MPQWVWNKCCLPLYFPFLSPATAALSDVAGGGHWQTCLSPPALWKEDNSSLGWKGKIISLVGLYYTQILWLRAPTCPAAPLPSLNPSNQLAWNPAAGRPHLLLQPSCCNGVSIMATSNPPNLPCTSTARAFPRASPLRLSFLCLIPQAESPSLLSSLQPSLCQLIPRLPLSNPPRSLGNICRATLNL